MARRDPNKLYATGLRRPDTLSRALKESLKKPYIGVTQGGSSRKDRGARVAATTADAQRTTRRKPNG